MGIDSIRSGETASFFCALLRSKIVAPKQDTAVYRNMPREVGADDSLPALDVENLPAPAPQPMADADRDADQHSSDEIMEPRKDAAEHALPLGDDVVQPVQGSCSSSSSSSSSSTCWDNIEEPAGCAFPCRGISDDASCDMKTVRRCGGIGVSFCSATSEVNDQRAAYATPGAVRAFGLPCCVCTKSEHQGAELKRAISVSSQHEWLHNKSFM